MIELHIPTPISPTAEQRVPPSGNIPWHISKLKGVENPGVEPIMAKSWALARAMAMIIHRCSLEEVTIDPMSGADT